MWQMKIEKPHTGQQMFGICFNCNYCNYYSIFKIVAGLFSDKPIYRLIAALQESKTQIQKQVYRSDTKCAS